MNLQLRVMSMLRCANQGCSKIGFHVGQPDGVGRGQKGRKEGRKEGRREGGRGGGGKKRTTSALKRQTLGSPACTKAAVKGVSAPLPPPKPPLPGSGFKDQASRKKSPW